MMTTKDIALLSFDEAMDQIKVLTADIESMNEDLDTLIEKVKVLKALIRHCEHKLQDAENEIRDIFQEEE